MPSAPLTIPVPEFAPDMPAFNARASAKALNVVPRTLTSYGPLQDISPYSSALTNRCQGAAAFLDSSSDVDVFAGDSADLYLLTSASTSFSAVSNGTHPYTAPSDALWSFAQFGQRILAAEINDPIQSYLMGSSSKFADLAYGGITGLTLTAGSGYTPGTYTLAPTNVGSGTGFSGTVTVGSDGKLDSFSITAPGRLYGSSATIPIPAGAGSGTGGGITPTIATVAPKAKYLAVVRNFLVGANTNDPVNGAQVQRVWWSALNDPTNFPTPGTAAAATVQSDYNDLLGKGGAIYGIVGGLGTADGAVFMEDAVYRMVYAGPAAVFDFFVAEGVRGTRSPGSIVQVGPVVFYLGRDGFYRFDGTVSTPIGATNSEGITRVDKWFYANVDLNNLSRVVGAADPVNKLIYWAWPDLTASNGNPNNLLIYNWELDRWSWGQITVELLVAVKTFGTTIDAWTTPYGTLDAVPFNFDSQAWIGGKDIFGAFDTSHKLGFFNGTNLQATIDFGEVQPFPGRLAMVKNARPLVDGGSPTVAIGTRNRTEDTPSFNAATSLNSLGTCPQRATGRYVRGEVVIPANSNWSHIQGLELEASAAGVR